MKQDRLIDVKLKNMITDVTGHKIGNLFYRVSPRNWKWYNPLHWFARLWGYEPVWVIDCFFDDYDNPICYGVAKLYECRLSDLKTLDDLMQLIDKFEEPYLKHYEENSYER